MYYLEIEERIVDETKHLVKCEKKVETFEFIGDGYDRMERYLGELYASHKTTGWIDDHTMWISASLGRYMCTYILILRGEIEMELINKDCTTKSEKEETKEEVKEEVKEEAKKGEEKMKYKVKDRVLVPAEVIEVHQYYDGSIVYVIEPMNCEPEENGYSIDEKLLLPYQEEDEDKEKETK